MTRLIPFAIAVLIVGLTTASASAHGPYAWDPYGWHAAQRNHTLHHLDLEHRAFHRELQHREAHRYPMTWWQHERLHDQLDHEAFHDHLEHRAAHATGAYYPRYHHYYGPKHHHVHKHHGHGLRIGKGRFQVYLGW